MFFPAFQLDELPGRLFVRAVACAAAVAVWGGGDAFATTRPQEQQVFQQIKTAPGQKRPFVEVDPILSEVARARARDMADRNFFGHVNPDGVGPNYAVERAGYKLPDGWTDDRKANYIESIAAGFTSVGAVWQAWMTSEGHRDHLLAQNPFYKNQTSVGVGYVYRENSKYKHYWVVLTAPPNRAASVRITSPANGSILTSGTLAVAGTVANPGTAAKVEVCAESWKGSTPWVEATGTGSWSAEISGMDPGKNTIRARSLNAEGKVLDTATATVHYRVEVPFDLRIQGEGRVTGLPMGVTGQALGYLYTLKAIPAQGYRFAGWTGTFPSASKKVEVRLESAAVMQANFVPNPFPERRGKYVGILGGGHAGMVSLDLGKRGGFSGKLVVGGRKVFFKGRFSPAGLADIVAGGLEISLTLDTVGHSGIVGSVAENGVSLPFEAAMAPVAERAKYGLDLGQASGVGAPDGTGSARVNVAKSGRARVSGVLADGTAFVRGTFLTVGGNMPLYVPLYGTTGSLSGNVALVNPVSGVLDWRKPGEIEAEIPVTGGPLP